MPTVKLRFPGGRYHATPWGHHVNEGLIEWPPCPWRLLRALIATGYSKLDWGEVPLVARRLIDKLAAVLPLYHLPAASAAHSRHFMPIGDFKKPEAKYRTVFQFAATTSQRADLYNHFTEDTTLVFDTWANVGSGEMLIHWPCQLDAEESELLRQLVAMLSYLGRSESWVEAQLTDDHSAEWNAVPCQEGEHRGPGWEQVSLMAPIVPDDYRKWREEATAPVLATIQKPTSKKVTPKQLQNYQAQCRLAVSPYPEDLIDCLTKDTFWWKGHGWSQPPGSRRVLYWRCSDALQVGVPLAPKRIEPPGVECMLLAIASPSGNKSALPHVHRTLPQAEHLRRALICRAADGARIDCPSLLGKIDGERIRGSHDHAHFIPLDLDGDQFLDHILIYAKGKLCGTAQRAIRSLKRTWTKGGAGDLQLAVVGSGDRDMLRRLPPPLRLQLDEILGPPEGATEWVSATPLVLPRFLKSKGKDTLEGQVQAELASRGLPAAEQVEIDRELTRSLRHFVRRRTHGGVPPKVDTGYGLRLWFREPIHGPLLLGYASHYGLGLFRACGTAPLIVTITDRKDARR
jgi:CRISPR-associated protein Csb2